MSVINFKSSSSDEFVVGTNLLEIVESTENTAKTCDIPGTVTTSTEYDTLSATNTREGTRASNPGKATVKGMVEET